jgi:alkanesulfonate monooxygenase SsuD/methylene tetrahydromethanopterin reductase-like flavin-dependent oxidoreductase (luciferase family)
MLEVVAAHADVWDVNLPPIARYVEPAAALLEEACRARSRDPHEIARSMLIFTRVEEDPAPGAALAAFRRLNPWFRWIPDAEIGPSLVVGSPERCRERLAALADALAIDHPVLDLAGLDAAATRRVLEGLSPERWGPSRN